jgi:hypothetical protein
MHNRTVKGLLGIGAALALWLLWIMATGQREPDRAKAASPSVPSVLRDTSLPEAQRREVLAQLARDGDAGALMAVIEEGGYFSAAAVEWLGQMRPPATSDYLRGKLDDNNPRVAAAAFRSLAQVDSANAVPVMAAALQQNRRRPDGFQDMVCAAAVDALATTKSPAAVPVLAEELSETVGKVLGHDYGSQVVQALVTVGDVAAVEPLGPTGPGWPGCWPGRGTTRRGTGISKTSWRQWITRWHCWRSRRQGDEPNLAQGLVRGGSGGGGRRQSQPPPHQLSKTDSNLRHSRRNHPATRGVSGIT